MNQIAQPPASPATSTTKSADVSPLSKAMASAVDNSLARTGSLSALDPANQSTPDEWDGRRHLSGAFAIELRRIRPDPNQPRRDFNDEKQQQLNASVQVHGIMSPIRVRYLKDEKIYQIISGERRYHAALANGLTEIPCVVGEPEEEMVLVQQIVENVQRADLHPMEFADSLGVLRDRWNYSQSKIAELIGKSKGEVSKFLSLLTLDPAVQEQCRADRSGRITRSHLEALARAPQEAQAEVLEQVQAGDLTVKETERLAEEAAAKRSGTKTRGAPIGCVFRYKTMKATVTIAFRRNRIDREEVLEALEQTREKITRYDDLA